MTSAGVEPTERVHRTHRARESALTVVPPCGQRTVGQSQRAFAASLCAYKVRACVLSTGVHLVFLSAATLAAARARRSTPSALPASQPALVPPCTGCCRYEAARNDHRKIYSRAGQILVAVNPFSLVNGLYKQQVMDDYKADVSSNAPHIYEIAEKAFRGVRGHSQAIVINGESGAGKTVTANELFRYLTFRSGDGGDDLGDIAGRLHASSPVLEAFGNALTLRNDNSSRFGKFVKLQFASSAQGPQLRSAEVEHYLLEKPRVCAQSDQEQNYHIFYYLSACADPTLREELGLGPVAEVYERFHAHGYLNRPNVRAGSVASFQQELEDVLKQLRRMSGSDELSREFCKVGVHYHHTTRASEHAVCTRGARARPVRD